MLTMKKARLLADLTQEQAAKKLGVSRCTYSRLERNPELVTIGQAKKFCMAVGVSVDAIFFSA